MAARLSAKKLQVVAAALDIQPVMPSRWRQEAREGRLRGSEPQAAVAPQAPLRELKRLQALERAHALLQEEHELLRKAIRFCSERSQTSSSSSRVSAKASR
jgi:transposase